MEKQNFKIKETNILRKIIGNKLERICYTEPIFGKLKLVFEDNAVIISNEIHEEKLLGDIDEISYFAIEKFEKDYDFRHFKDNESIKDLNVNEKILGIEIVNDLIKYNNEYEISYDMAIIIKTKKHEYTISRDWFYMETMEISIDKDIDDILNKNDIIEQYKGEDEIQVSLIRKKESI